MAQCIYLNTDGTLTASTETSDQCQGYVLQSRAEYASSQALQTFLAMPTQEQVTQAFYYGCAFPMFLYMVAWGVGAVANFFNDKE